LAGAKLPSMSGLRVIAAMPAAAGNGGDSSS
jgi:hypothetical protein